MFTRITHSDKVLSGYFETEPDTSQVGFSYLQTENLVLREEVESLKNLWHQAALTVAKLLEERHQ